MAENHAEETLRVLSERLGGHGLILRGGFHPETGEADLDHIGTVLMVGNAGPGMWAAFSPEIDGEPDPLNRWTERVMATVGAAFGAEVRYPFGTPAWPFQRWAQRAEPVFPSPLGLLIHPRYGLWHAWRAALLFSKRLPLPERGEAVHPCATCAERPCLSACPVGAFTGVEYDVPRCAAHIGASASGCRDAGCGSRDACPVGTEWRYPAEQVRFHMAAFAGSVLTTG